MAQIGKAWGSARTKKDRVQDERRHAAEDGLDIRSLIAAYVIIEYLGRATPCPNLERAQDYARMRGTIEHPVVVTKAGRKLYRYPEE